MADAVSILPEFTPEQLLLNQHLQRLDDVSRKMESKWGVNRLEKCVDADLRAKWTRQWDKLNLAITEQKHGEAIELAQGCVRAWEALEKAAMASGYQPDVGVAMEARMPSGRVLRVCSSRLDALKPVPEGYTVWSMEQVARVLDKMELINVIEEENDRVKGAESGETITKLPKEFWTRGDEIGF